MSGQMIGIAWTLIDRKGRFLYVLGSSAQDVYEKAVTQEILGTGTTREMLSARGYKAKQIDFSVV